MFSSDALNEYLACLSDDDFIRIYGACKENTIDNSAIFKRIITSDHPEIYFTIADTCIQTEKEPNLPKNKLLPILRLTDGKNLEFYINELYKHIKKDYTLNFANSISTDLAKCLRENLPYEELLDTLSYTTTLENYTVIIYYLKKLGYSLDSECSFFALKNAVLGFLVPPYISDRPLPIETHELIKKMSFSHRSEIRDFVFKKILSVDIQVKLGILLAKHGIDCLEQLELAQFKLRTLHLIPEDLKIELLQRQTIQDAREFLYSIVHPTFNSIYN